MAVAEYGPGYYSMEKFATTEKLDYEVSTINDTMKDIVRDTENNFKKTNSVLFHVQSDVEIFTNKINRLINVVFIQSIIIIVLIILTIILFIVK